MSETRQPSGYRNRTSPVQRHHPPCPHKHDAPVELACTASECALGRPGNHEIGLLRIEPRAGRVGEVGFPWASCPTLSEIVWLDHRSSRRLLIRGYELDLRVIRPAHATAATTRHIAMAAA